MLIAFKSIVATVAILVNGIALEAQDDPVLLTIDGEPVHLSEFTYIYEKNNGDQADYSKESIDEYLRLFTNFKLKVKRARDLKLDTIPELKTELKGYREQLADSYMMDKELSGRLLQEMYDRRQEDVNISHILIRTRPNANHEEIKAAREKATAIMAKIKSGASFESLVATDSEDNTTKDNGGNIGWVTSWLPDGFYQLENAAYNTPVGEITGPVVTKLGVHIVKVLDRRPAYGKIEVAHILIRHDSPRKDVVKTINDIYRIVTSDKDFHEVAQSMSEDNATKLEGGRLKPFGINTFDRKFEAAAFALQEDGDISEPIKTKVGWHVIKRLSKPDETKQAFFARMKPQLPKLDRYKEIKSVLIEEIKKDVGYDMNEEVYSRLAENLADNFFSYQWVIPGNLKNGILFHFGDFGPFELLDFAKFVKNSARSRMRYNREKTPQEALRLILDEYIGGIAMEYQEKNLENKYPDFKNLMREYSEGILLFEISKNKVWDHASKDTSGLRKFYQRNQKNYIQPPSALLSLFTISEENPRKVAEIYQFAEQNSTDHTMKAFNSDREVLVIEQKEMTRDKVMQLEIEEKLGGTSALKRDQKTGLTSFYKIEKFIPMRIKKLSESRGYVIADYQQYLEEKWVEELRKDYNIHIAENVLNGLIK